MADDLEAMVGGGGGGEEFNHSIDLMVVLGVPQNITALMNPARERAAGGVNFMWFSQIQLDAFFSSLSMILVSEAGDKKLFLSLRTPCHEALAGCGTGRCARCAGTHDNAELHVRRGLDNAHPPSREIKAVYC